MALTQNNCMLIKAVAENNITLARKAAMASCVEDTSKKNSFFTLKYEKILSAEESAAEIFRNIPANLKSKLVGEPPENFVNEQYFLSEREKDIFERISRMKAVAEEMAAIGISYHNATLLYGLPGTGKTMLGKYIAYKLQLPYFYLNFSQMVDSYLGGTAGNIHKAFSFIQTIHCVFMIDEIDCIAAKRSSGGSKGADGEIERTTISIMQEIDSLPNSVILIGATNRVDLIDDALMRRFPVKHEVLPLTEDEAAEMINRFLQDVNTKLSNRGRQIIITEDWIRRIIREQKMPALIMNEVIQETGRQLYEQCGE